jgi:DNA-binding transcriptional regulator LsrR (DeoR family)
MAQRSISLRLEELAGRTVIGIAGGADKVDAIRATLRSGLLSGLITDETTARAILEQKASRRAAAKPARRGKRPPA